MSELMSDAHHLFRAEQLPLPWLGVATENEVNVGSWVINFDLSRKKNVVPKIKSLALILEKISPANTTKVFCTYSMCQSPESGKKTALTNASVHQVAAWAWHCSSELMYCTFDVGFTKKNRGEMGS